MSPSRIESKLRIWEAYFSNEDGDMLPTGINSIRTCASDAKAWVSMGFRTRPDRDYGSSMQRAFRRESGM